MAETGLRFLPGTSTVSEALAVLEAGFTEMKFFPAEACGGAAYLASVASPVPAAQNGIRSSSKTYGSSSLVGSGSPCGWTVT